MELFDEKVKRLLKWEKGQKQGPVELQLNPTDRCNLLCKFCWLRDKSRVSYENEITDERYTQLIQEAKDLDVRSITITGGGEPMVRKKLVLELVKKIKENNIYGIIITNGTLFDEKSIKTFVEYCWNEIVFSVDSPKAEIHDYLRECKGCFDKTIQAIKDFDRIKKELNLHLPKLCVHYVLTNKNYDQILDMIEFIDKLSVKNFFVEPVVSVSMDTDFGEKLKLKNAKQIKEAVRQIKKGYKTCCEKEIENNLEFLHEDLISNVNVMNKVVEKEAKKNGKKIMKKEKTSFALTPCFEPFLNVIIRPNGRVGPCCMFEYTGEYIHNKPLKDIWFGNKFNQARESLRKGVLLSYCKQCNPSQVVGNRRVREKLLKKIKQEKK